MKVYTAHIPQKLEDTVFVPEGMAWPCLVIPVAWMLWYRMWVPASIVFACSLAIAAIGKVGGDPLTANLIGFGFQAIVALEANNLRRWTLDKNGYREAGLVAASNLEEAELRYFTSVDPALLQEATTEAASAITLRPAAPGQPRAVPRADKSPIGIFPEATAQK